ncbi:cyclase family protein [Haloplanus litoreus]|uniref:Cyclase family protein n=1 Tax=Haloplanus litoreus TaxID=767515 RepID=A0ABD5ZZN6_9EURY
MSDGDSVVEAFASLADADWVDLTHTLEEDIPSVPTHARYGHTLYQSYEYGDPACHYRISMGEHSGTHMDAPLHFVPDGEAHYDIASVPLDRLVGRTATIEVTDLGPDDRLTVDHVTEWEAEHGDVEAGDRVLFRFGWDERWDTGKAGQAFYEDWPGLSREAAEYLTDRDVTMVGTDAFAIDAARAEGFPAHYELLGNETYILENLANLSALPPFSLLFTFPLKIAAGSGSPIRAVALVE